MVISMARTLPRPTDAELEILRVLWERGPSTVRQVYEALAGSRETGYTTTLKLMQIMAEKGLVTRDESSRTHVYGARASRDVTQRQLVRDLLDRAFGGSAGRLVLQALSAVPPSREELAEIQRLIARYKERRES
jgi:predicted transcriptional regulator